MITKQIINFNLNIIMMFALLFSALLVASFNNISNQRLFLRHLTVCWSIHICCKEALKGLGVGFDSSNHPEVWKLIQSFYIFHFLKKEKKPLEISCRQPFSKIIAISDSVLKWKNRRKEIHVKYFRKIQKLFSSKVKFFIFFL